MVSSSNNVPTARDDRFAGGKGHPHPSALPTPSPILEKANYLCEKPKFAKGSEPEIPRCVVSSSSCVPAARNDRFAGGKSTPHPSYSNKFSYDTFSKEKAESS